VRVREDDNLARCDYTSMRKALIIHHFHDNKRGITTGVTFRAIHPAKSNRPFVRRAVPDFLLSPPGRLSLLAMMMSVKKSRPTKSENDARLTTDLGDASTSKERYISLPGQIQMVAEPH